MKVEPDIKLDFSDVLIVPKRSTLKSRNDVDLQVTYTFKHSGWTYTGVPIMAANMDGVGTFEMANTLHKDKLFTCLVKSYDINDFTKCETNIGIHFSNHIAISTGISDKDYNKLVKILTAYPELHFICIDVANGYSQHFVEFISKVREAYPTHTIIAGNVVTPEMTEELIFAGADIIKVGIGPGSVCSTRTQTGIGYPQFSAVLKCAEEAHALGAHVISDGGCTCPGDVAKAFGAGADFVMLGGMLAGCDEGGGEVITKFYRTNKSKNGIMFPTKENSPIYEEKKFVQFYGMSSKTAMVKHHGGVAEYRSSEGKTIEVPYKGAVSPIIYDILGGIRSTLTYCGAKTLQDLNKCATFIRVNNQLNRVYEKFTVGN